MDTGDRLDSIECAACGTSVTYAGRGRPPRYCSASCRRTGWSLDQATARLEAGQDPRPQVVTETVTRDQVRSPASVGEWNAALPQLGQYLHQTRGENTAPASDYHQLAAQLWDALATLQKSHGQAVDWDQLANRHADLIDRMTVSTPAEPAAAQPASEPAGMSRQQRRAADRAARKHH